VRPHWTKVKGDLGVLHAQVDLAERGFGILMPLTEHESFDLVAYRDDRFYRVQVRYRRVVAGRLDLRFRTSWADRRGSHNKPMDKASVDVLCVYCPDTQKCYYIEPRRFAGGVRLRISPSRNKQSKGVHTAEDFTDFPLAP